jgi:NAD-dependent dihydropyrimidine dehydrogenase PreA subunit
MELVSDIANRLGKGAGIRQRNLPLWVTAGFAALGLYISLQFVVPVFDVDKLPLATAGMLIVLGSVALLTGFLFGDGRAFCKGFCPASLLLRAYSLVTPLATRNRSDQLCASCTTRDCVSQARRDRHDARSCPSSLRPFALTKQEDCINCFQCAKVCPRNNVGFGLLRHWREERGGHALRLSLAIFIFVEAGYLSHELFEESSYNGLFRFVPERCAALFGNQALFPFLEAAWFLVLIPGAVALAVWALGVAGRQRSSLPDYFSKTALAFLPVLVTGHAAKAIIKLNAVAGYLPYALQHPLGLNTAARIVDRSMPGVAPLLPQLNTTLVLTVAVAVAVAFSMARARRKLEGAPPSGAYAAIALFGGLYFFVIFTLFISLLKGAA